MSRYQTPSGPEAEYEPGSNGRVLRNKLGVISERRMEVAEAKALEVAQLRYISSGEITADTQYNAALILAMHGDWLGAIYDWAGKYSSVELVKDEFPFPPANLIEQNMFVLETDLLATLTPCRRESVDEACFDAAKVHADLLLIHPFREGTGDWRAG